MTLAQTLLDSLGRFDLGRSRRGHVMGDYGAANDNSGKDGGADRRRAPRRRVLLHGKLAYPHNSFSGDCTIRNLSATGAQIALPSVELLRRDPFLIVVREGVAHETRTTWVRGRAVGLSFGHRIPLGGEVPAHMQGLRRLWVENLPR